MFAIWKQNGHNNQKRLNHFHSQCYRSRSLSRDSPSPSAFNTQSLHIIFAFCTRHPPHRQPFTDRHTHTLYETDITNSMHCFPHCFRSTCSLDFFLLLPLLLLRLFETRKTVKSERIKSFIIAPCMAWKMESTRKTMQLRRIRCCRRWLWTEKKNAEKKLTWQKWER